MEHGGPHCGVLQLSAEIVRMKIVQKGKKISEVFVAGTSHPTTNNDPAMQRSSSVVVPSPPFLQTQTPLFSPSVAVSRIIRSANKNVKDTRNNSNLNDDDDSCEEKVIKDIRCLMMDM